MDKPAAVRRKRKFKSPNPLFEQWLTEWKDAAASKGLKAQFIYAKALSSLKKYPLPLSSGKEAKILEYFGDKICSMLDERLQHHRLNQNGSDCEDGAKQSSNAPNNKEMRTSSDISQVKKEKTSPSIASIVLPPTFVTPVLTEDPEEFVNSFSLHPGTFEIILCIDSIETSAGHSKHRKQFLSEIQKCNIPFEIRKLNVADFIWIAKERNSASNPQRELVMDFVVERKRLDDLAHSIKDGRFREQKFRLKNCGARKPIYLIEYHKSHQYVGIPESTLEQAVINTQVIDGFIIKRTCDMKESIAYLSSITKYLQNSLQMQTLSSGTRQVVRNNGPSAKTYVTFEDYNCGAVKNKCLSVREMFAKQLLQFHGLSVDRAAAVVEKFDTPSKLFEALQSCSTDTERVQMMADIKYGKYKRSFGQALARVVQQFYSTAVPLQ